MEKITTKEEMIELQLKARGIRDIKVLDAMNKVPRELFLDPHQHKQAYMDNAIPIGYGQSISQPYIVAFMIEASEINSDSKVLEIGTGCGYQTAILAEIAKEIYSLEIINGFIEKSKTRLMNLGYHNVEIKNSDGYSGWQEKSPFDAIIVSAAPLLCPPNLINQLKVGGRLIIPIGHLDQNLIRMTKTTDNVNEELLLPVRFVPMIH